MNCEGVHWLENMQSSLTDRSTSDRPVTKVTPPMVVTDESISPTSDGESSKVPEDLVIKEESCDMTEDLPLPDLSSRVTNALLQDKSVEIWMSLIDELQLFYSRYKLKDLQIQHCGGVDGNS